MSQTAPPDYSRWTQDQLIRRVKSLERHLQQTNIARPLGTSDFLPIPMKDDISQASEISNSQPMPKKDDIPASDSKIQPTCLIALKFAYIGRHFNGLEYHANNITPLPTVEEELWKALTKARLVHGDADAPDWSSCGFSKCGRTDRGVSAFGQVVCLRVRTAVEPLPYAKILNRLLPPSIRVLAYNFPPDDFSARFNCKTRTYKYFFTNPAFAQPPATLRISKLPTESDGDVQTMHSGFLDIPRMHDAAARFEGLHDFRNFCKIDASKQLTQFMRRIHLSTIVEEEPRVYSFTLTGSAFLWHQVRHMMAILFLVGQRKEDPSLVDHLLDIDKCPSKPLYEMADDRPLVLWDSAFSLQDRVKAEQWLEDEIGWTYVDGYGTGGLVSSLWSRWHEAKMDEVLARKLLGLAMDHATAGETQVSQSEKVYQGGSSHRLVGKYRRVLDRQRMEPVEIINGRWHK